MLAALAFRTPRLVAAALLLLFALFSACGGKTQPERDPESDRQQVEAAARRVWDALNRNDPAALLAEYADDAIVFPDGMPMVRGNDVAKYLGGIFAAVTFRDVTGTLVDIRLGGDLAVETGTIAWTLVRAGGAPTPGRVKYIHVWQRTPAGAWKVIRYFANSDTAPSR
jgi:ketosteroid isomerase-like protein